MVATVGGLEERECCVHARALVTWRDHEQEWSPGRKVHGRGAWHALVRWVGATGCAVFDEAKRYIEENQTLQLHSQVWLLQQKGVN